jgi:hypothetical protein
MESENKIKMTCDVIKEMYEGYHTIKIENAHGDTMIEVQAVVEEYNGASYYPGAFEIINTIFDKDNTLRIINDCINDSNVDLFIDRDDAIDMIISNRYYDSSDSDNDDYYMECSTFDDQDDDFVSIYELDNDDLEKVINDNYGSGYNE